MKHTTEEFVKIWQSSETKSEAIKRFGQPSSLITNRASCLRKRGVNLKKFKAVGNPATPLDIKALNKIAASSLKP